MKPLSNHAVTVFGGLGRRVAIGLGFALLILLLVMSPSHRVYGDGPTFNPSKPTKAGRMYDGIKLRVGKVAKNPDPLPDPSGSGIRARA